MDFQQSVTLFSKLSYEDKKKKVISMLEILKEEGNVFDDLRNLVNINETVSESILEMVYQVITKAMYNLKAEEMEEAVEKLEKVKDIVKNIQSKEEAEKEDVDALLQNM